MVEPTASSASGSAFDEPGRPGGTPDRTPWSVLAVIAAGGALGALARYGLATGWPFRPGRFPWPTFITNLSGCLLIGVLMVMITEMWPARRLLRPFLGVGVLGGYTTFSAYAVEAWQLVAVGAANTASLYLIGTLVGALASVYAGMTVARLLTGVSRRREDDREAR